MKYKGMYGIEKARPQINPLIRILDEPNENGEFRVEILRSCLNHSEPFITIGNVASIKRHFKICSEEEAVAMIV